MDMNLVFYALFFCQVLLISGYLPAKIIGFIRTILSRYPQHNYPHLYPLPTSYLGRGLTLFQVMNYVNLLVGLAVGIISWFLPEKELLGWDNQAVLAAYFFLQVLPILLLEFFGKQYFKLMRAVNKPRVRQASLKPRRILDFVSPGLLLMAIGCYLGFALLLFFLARNPADGFVGWWNLAWITLMNVILGTVIFWNLRGKKLLPDQDLSDHHRQISLLISRMLVISMASTLFLAVQLVLPILDRHDLSAAIMTVFFQIVALLSFTTLPFKTVVDDDSLAEA